MKKIILSILMSFSGSVLFAQTTVTLPNTTSSNSGIKTYQYSDSSGNSQTITSPVPGVYIKSPQWVQDIATVAKDAANTKAANEATSSSTTVNAANNINPNNITSTTPVQPTTPNQAINGALPEKNTTPQPTVTAQRRVGQVKDTSVNSYSNQISSWNQSTLQEFESSGQEKLQKSYSDFLIKR